MAEDETESIKAALREVMQPLAELMIAKGVTVAAATELLKEALFLAAQTRGTEEPPSDSKISLLTGLHRKDVRRFREATVTARRKSFMNAASRVLTVWSTDPAFLASDGRPLPLQRTAAAGPSFERLVATARADLAPGTILAHLKETGSVDESAETLRLVRSAYLPGAGSVEMIGAFQKNIQAHLWSAVGNLTSDEAPANFERASHFNRLSESSAAELEILARNLAERHLEEFNRMASRRQEVDKAQPSSTHRISFGSYVFESDVSKQNTRDK